MKYLLHRNGEIIMIPGSGGNKNPDLLSAGNTRKKFLIDYTHYRILSGVACELWSKRTNNIIFLTLTSRDPINHKSFNQLISKFTENLKLNYELKNYIWTAENQKRGAIHYHFLLDIPYFDIQKLRKYYNKLIKPYSRASDNNFRLDNTYGTSVVSSREACVKYICKYISGSIARKREERSYSGEKQYFEARCYNYSRGLTRKAIELSEKEMEKFCRENVTHQKVFNFVTVKFTSNKEDLYNQVKQIRDTRKKLYFDDKDMIQEKIRFKDPNQAKPRKTTEKPQKTTEKPQKTTEKPQIRTREQRIQDFKIRTRIPVKSRESIISEFEKAQREVYQLVTEEE